MKERGHLHNVEKIGTTIVPKRTDREKVNKMEFFNYHSNERDERVVQYGRKKLKNRGERTMNLIIKMHCEAEWRESKREKYRKKYVHTTRIAAVCRCSHIYVPRMLPTNRLSAEWRALTL